MGEKMTLLPCPFCGHAELFDQWPCEWLDGSGVNVVRCPMCHGAAPEKCWNRRHLTQPAQCPYIASSDEGTHYCRLAESAKPAQAVDVEAEDRFEQYVKTLIDKAPDVQKLGERLAHLLDEDQFNNIEPTLLGIARALGNAPENTPDAAR